MIFFKYEATGNDFLLVKGPISHPSNLARKICHRRFGIGADGMIIALRSEIADIKMVYYNSDGSLAPMCGNGLRAFTHFVYSQKFVNKSSFQVETNAGVHDVTLMENQQVKIVLNEPRYRLDAKDVLIPQVSFSPTVLQLKTNAVTAYILDTGTLHTVLFVDDLDSIDIENLGNEMSTHHHFPEKTNVNFVQVINRSTLKVITYERGVGQTLSCGTGASASAVVATKLLLTDHHVEVQVLGGYLQVDVGVKVELTGPQNYVAKIDYQGTI